MIRYSYKQLALLKQSLNERDLRILSTLFNCRYLLPEQIRRLFFVEASSETAGLRNSQLVMKRLNGLGLVDTFRRHFGGLKPGSTSYVWHLTEAGYRMLCMDQPQVYKRKRFLEPSESHLFHTVAISECWIQLVEIERKYNAISLTKTEFEPNCWRTYPENEKLRKLQPDLFVTTEDKEYEYRWFIEVDLGTESLRMIMSKCEMYHQYFKSGREQRNGDVFPLVVWLVKSQTRKDNMIAEIKETYKNRNHLFVVITPEELEPLIINGAKKDQII